MIEDMRPGRGAPHDVARAWLGEKSSEQFRLVGHSVAETRVCQQHGRPSDNHWETISGGAQYEEWILSFAQCPQRKALVAYSLAEASLGGSGVPVTSTRTVPVRKCSTRTLRTRSRGRMVHMLRNLRFEPAIRPCSSPSGVPVRHWYKTPRTIRIDRRSLGGYWGSNTNGYMECYDVCLLSGNFKRFDMVPYHACVRRFLLSGAIDRAEQRHALSHV